MTTRALVLTLAVALASGCESPSPPGASNPNPAKGSAAVESGNGSKPSATADGDGGSQSGGAKIAVAPTDPEGLRKVVQGFSDQKKVVLIDFWGTWCEACMKRFPHTVELAGHHADDGLAVISVALEFDPEKSGDAVLKFLTDRKAAFTNLMSTSPLDEAIPLFGMDTDDGLPQYWIYGRDGKLLKKFITVEDPDKSFTDADVAAAVKEALGEKAK